MAAAIIPIAETVIPLVFPLVAKLMDKIFGNGNGPTVKLPTGVMVAQTILTEIQKQLGLSVGVPTSTGEISQNLQQAVSTLNAQGVLKGTATVIDGAAAVTQALPNKALLMSLLGTAVEIVKAGA